MPHRSREAAAAFRTADAPRADLLDACVRCGACIQSCPTYQQLGIEPDDPRGRIFLITAAHDGHVTLNETFEKHIYRCLDCRACETVCPMGVQVGRLIEEVRGEIRQVRPARGWSGRVLRFVLRRLFPYPRRLELLGWMVGVLQRTPIPALARRLRLTSLLPTHVASMERSLPPIPLSSARKRLRAVPPVVGTEKGNVALLHGCVMSVVFAEAVEATTRVLARNGWAVTLPQAQSCCGALHVHEGDRDMGKMLARRNIAAFEMSNADAYVVNAAGCGSALKAYGTLLANDPDWAERAASFSAKVRDVQEFLVKTGWRPPNGSFEARAVYQDACHLAHAQGIREAPRELLHAVPGLVLEEMVDSDRCCGSAGIYNLTHPEIAEPLLARKVADIPTDTEVLITANPGCHLQLARGLMEGGRTVRIMHLMEVLDAAYAAEPEVKGAA